MGINYHSLHGTEVLLTAKEEQKGSRLHDFQGIFKDLDAKGYIKPLAARVSP